MKFLTLSLAAFAAFAVSAFAQVPVGPGAVKLGKVEVTAPSTPEFQITGGQNKRYKLGKWLELEVEFETKPEEIDELTFRYTALIEKKVLTGEVTYVNIAKARDHFAVMYISPKGIERLTGGKPLTSAGVENVWIEVSRQGQVLDKTSLRPGPVPNLPQVPGLILKKDDTPFGPLYYDRYESIKQVK